MGDEVAQRPAQLRARPTVELQGAQARVVLRPFDGVVFARQVVGREAPGDGLLVQRVGLLQCMQLAGLGLRFGAQHMLDAGQRQQLAGFSGIDEQGGREHQIAAGCDVVHRHGTHRVA